MRIICNIIIIILLFLPYSSFATKENNQLPLSKSLLMDAKEVLYDAKKDLIIAQGNVTIFMDNYRFNADLLTLDIKNNLMYAQGNVRIENDLGKVIIGEGAVFQHKLKWGIIEEFAIRFVDNSIVAAKLGKILNDKQMVLYKSSFTPCSVCKNKKPFWQVSARDTYVDLKEETIIYKHAFFQIYGTPIMYAPFFSHPTPNASAKSGFLVPEMKSGGVLIPFYYRAKSNLDITLSPRVAKKYIIYEAELRHKLKYGQYQIAGSYGTPPFKVKTDNNQELDKTDRYHIFTNGNFHNNNLWYGFDVRRSSDKAYLKNYHQMYGESYLTSKLYTYTLSDRNYLNVEGYYFQDLREKQNSQFNVPVIFPFITSQNIIPINDDETIYAAVKNSTLVYNEQLKKRIARTAFDLSLNTNYITDSGQLYSFALANRMDAYSVNLVAENLTDKDLNLYRNIPEFQSKWQLPISRALSPKTSIDIEPTTSITIGKKFDPKYNKFGIVDASKYELMESNLFNPNRFNGVDYHEYGNRLNYGLGSTLLSESYYLKLFLGSTIYEDNVDDNNNMDYVGSSTLDILNNVELFYSFRRTKDLKPIRDEVNLTANYDRYSANVGFSSLNNISKYYAEDDFFVAKNKIKQLYSGFEYKLTSNISLGASSRIDFERKKFKLLERTIKMTYHNDCASISLKIYDNYTINEKIGVSKARRYGFKIGLKVLNM
ncbi:MAG: LPS-assembly protein LptD [Rickettsiaceae bacterium]|nr:LPS-assembly protein LptD [Rickettsiaceae bacterium]